MLLSRYATVQVCYCIGYCGAALWSSTRVRWGCFCGAILQNTGRDFDAGDKILDHLLVVLAQCVIHQPQYGM